MGRNGIKFSLKTEAMDQFIRICGQCGSSDIGFIYDPLCKKCRLAIDPELLELGKKLELEQINKLRCQYSLQPIPTES